MKSITLDGPISGQLSELRDQDSLPRSKLIALAGRIDIAYRPVINEFRGRRNVEMHLVDWRLSEQPALTTSNR